MKLLIGWLKDKHLVLTGSKLATGCSCMMDDDAATMTIMTTRALYHQLHNSAQQIPIIVHHKP
jgi:hypothetical protein